MKTAPLYTQTSVAQQIAPTVAPARPEGGTEMAIIRLALFAMLVGIIALALS